MTRRSRKAKSRKKSRSKNRSHTRTELDNINTLITLNLLDNSSNNYTISNNVLTFKENFNSSITESYSNMFYQSRINTIIFGKDFNQTIKTNTFPDNITIIYFGENFNQPIESYMLPSSITILKFGTLFNQPIDISTYQNLKKLDLGLSFDQPFEYIKLPNSLEYLNFGKKFNQSLDNIDFTNSNITTLKFGMSFNQSLDNVKFPSSLQTLELGLSFNQSLDNLCKNITVISNIESSSSKSRSSKSRSSSNKSSSILQEYKTININDLNESNELNISNIVYSLNLDTTFELKKELKNIENIKSIEINIDLDEIKLQQIIDIFKYINEIHFNNYPQDFILNLDYSKLDNTPTIFIDKIYKNRIYQLLLNYNSSSTIYNESLSSPRIDEYQNEYNNFSKKTNLKIILI